jgi:hypothetical protein
MELSTPQTQSQRTTATAQLLSLSGVFVLLLSLVGLALALWLLPRPLPPREIVLGDAQPAPTIQVRALFGFHDPETQGERHYRWSEGWARMTILNAYHVGQPLYMQLGICGCRQTGSQPAVQLGLNNQTTITLNTSDNYRRYTLLLPPGHPDLPDDLFVSLNVATTQIGSDPRQIGVQLDQVTLWSPTGPRFSWQTILLLSALSLLVGLGILRWTPPWSVRLSLFAALLLVPSSLLMMYQAQPLSPTMLVASAVIGIGLVAGVRPTTVPHALGLSFAIWLLCWLPVLLGSWVVDDAYISFRYALNLIEGHGLVFNPGERVEGYTNFLWTMLMAGVLACGADPAAAGRLGPLWLSQAILVLTFALGRWLVRQTTPSRVTSASLLVAPLVLASNAGWLLYTARGSGMETALFGLLILGGALLYLRSIVTPGWSGVCLAGAVLGLAAMTRPEGVLVAGITGLHLLLRSWQNRRILWNPMFIFSGGFLLIFGPYYTWRYSYYGLPLPNTFYAKVGASDDQVARGFGYMLDYWSSNGGLAFALGLGLLLGLLILQRNMIQNAHWLASADIYLVMLAGIYSSYIVAVGGDWMPGWRFVVPLVPLFALLAQRGLQLLLHHNRWWLLPVAGVLLVLSSGQVASVARTDAADSSNLIWRENEVVARRREAGRWLRENTPPDTLVAVEAAGALPYFSRRPALDILGLNDRHIASREVPLGSGKPGHEKTDIPYVLDRQPAVIPNFSVPYFDGQPRFEQNYHRAEYPGPEGFGLVLYRRITK